jgi:TP901 family phage tail tape measure protein
MAIDIATLGVRIDPTKAEAGLRRVDRSLDQTGRKAETTQRRVDRSSAKMGSGFQKVRSSALQLNAVLATMGLGVGFAASIRTLIDFQGEMARTRAVTGATAEDMAKLTAQARALGATTKFSAAEAASGMAFLGMAGFETNEILGAMPATLDLAAAANIDLGRAADITSNIMAGFSLQASGASKAADILAVVASNANTDISQMGDAMKFVAPIAKGFEVDMETTASAIGVLSNAGLQGSLAGTGLRVTLTRLMAPTNQVRKTLEALGLTQDDVNIKTHGLVGVLQNLKDAGIGAEEALAIAGQRGGPALEVLLSNVPKLQELVDKTNAAEGSARAMAETMMNTLGGSVAELKAAFEGFIITMGDNGFGGTVENSIDGLAEFFRILDRNKNTVMALVDTFLALGAVWLGLKVYAWGAAFITAAKGAAIFNVTLATTQGVLLAIAAAIASVLIVLNQYKAAIQDVNEMQSGLAAKNDAFFKSGQERVGQLRSEDDRQAFISDMDKRIQGLRAAQQDVRDSMAFGVGDSIGIVDKGTTITEIETAILRANELKKMASKADLQGARAADESAKAQEQLKQQVEITTGSLNEAITAYRGFVDAQKSAVQIGNELTKQQKTLRESISSGLGTGSSTREIFQELERLKGGSLQDKALAGRFADEAAQLAQVETQLLQINAEITEQKERQAELTARAQEQAQRQYEANRREVESKQAAVQALRDQVALQEAMMRGDAAGQRGIERRQFMDANQDAVGARYLGLMSVQELGAIFDRLQAIKDQQRQVKEEAEKMGLAYKEANFALGEIQAAGQSIQSNPFMLIGDKQKELHQNYELQIDALTRLIELTRQRAAITNDEAAQVELLAQGRQLEMQRAQIIEAQKQNSDMGQIQASLTEWHNSLGTTATMAADVLTGTLNTSIDSISQNLMGVINQTQSWGDAFQNVGNAILQTLQQMIIKMLVTKAIQSSLSAFGGFGPAPTAHTGGIIGSTDLGRKSISPRIPRYHTGGVNHDEQVAVLKKGEGVFTPDQMQAMGDDNDQPEKTMQMPTQIINVIDPRMVDEYLARNPNAVLNIIGQNRKTVREMVAIG